MKNKFGKLLIILVMIVIISILILSLLSYKVMPIYMSYADAEMQRLVTVVINKTISDDLKINSIDDLFIIKSDSNTNMTMVDFDPVVLNRVMSRISDIVYQNVKLIGEGDKETLEKYNVSSNIFYIPSGIIFNSTLLNNLGPKIPIKMEIISSVNPNIETKVTEYGINNSLVEVFIKVNASIKMILPLASSNIDVSVVVPISVKLIQGMVPDYYLGGLYNKSS